VQTWLSFHFYPLETQEIFLARAVKPFLAQYIWPTKGARAFFTRYEDARGPHVRLRLRGESAWVEETLRPAFEGWMADRGEWVEVDYVPENERFGGEEAMAWSEEYFHVSSRVVLDRLSSEAFTYGDALFDALRMHAMTVFAAGFDREKAAWYFGQLCEQWLPLFFQPAEEDSIENVRTEVLAGFAQNFEPQKGSLQESLTELWAALEAGKLDANRPEWARWLQGNQLILKELGEKLERALPSLIHLNNNRLGVNNQDEVYLNFILSKVL
jgi:thiopeptide-type bacteriocin biosynthesis protein